MKFEDKDIAYWERNQLVAALTKIFPAYLAKHPEDDKDWDAQWRTIVYVYIPAGETPDPSMTHVKLSDRDDTWFYQLSWHIHDSDLPNFDHLHYNHPANWDYHSTEEKYRRLRTLKPIV